MKMRFEFSKGLILLGLLILPSFAMAFTSRLINTKFYSRSLGREMPITIYLPYGRSSRGETYPVIYMLHGLSDHHNTWEKVARIKEVVDEMIEKGKLKKIVMVFPEGEESYYYNSARGNFEDYIIYDVIEYVEHNYPVAKTRDKRAILGISMGGAGAMRLALKYPNKFLYVFGLSGIYHPDYLGRELRAASLKRLNGLRIYFWAGSKDSAQQYALFLEKALNAKGIPHYFNVIKGKHDWPQWIPEIKLALQLFAQPDTTARAYRALNQRNSSE